MPVKPTEIVTWNPTKSNVTTPGAGLKAAGWVVDDVPGPDFQNWLHTIPEEWRAWFEGEFDRVFQITTSIWRFVENAAPFGRGNYIGAVGVTSGANLNVDLRWPLDLAVGTTIKRLKADASDSGVVGVIRLVRETLAGAKNFEITLPGFAPAFASQEVIADSAVVALGEKWYVQMITPGAGAGTIEVRSIEYDWQFDHTIQRSLDAPVLIGNSIDQARVQVLSDALFASQDMLEIMARGLLFARLPGDLVRRVELGARAVAESGPGVLFARAHATAYRVRGPAGLRIWIASIVVE